MQGRRENQGEKNVSLKEKKEKKKKRDKDKADSSQVLSFRTASGRNLLERSTSTAKIVKPLAHRLLDKSFAEERKAGFQKGKKVL